MPTRYKDAILKVLANRDYQPLKPRQLARVIGVADEDYGTFRLAVKQLRDSGRIVRGTKDALMLPEMGDKVVGFYRANPRGFGFVIPETPNAHGDLFIPPEANGGAMTGDLVQARVTSRSRREGQAVFRGQVVRIIRRGQSRFVGTLTKADRAWFVLPDGSQMTTPIVVHDVGAGARAGTKVVAEIVDYGKAGALPTGVIVDRLGEGGNTEVETRAVIRAYGLAEEFPQEVLEEARAAGEAFNDAADGDGREDLTRETVVTIDPPDARDYDDAISLRHGRDGTWTLGVHIADVSHFVGEGTALDAEARRRSTSVYFPRKVLPMIPPTLSNGVCSLQEGQRRFCKSVFITYDAEASVVSFRAAETVIRSDKRLTYAEAQGICDGKTGGYKRGVVQLVKDMERLARRIESRRRKAGMLHLDLPEVELVLDDHDKVTDAVKADDAYTHTIIEMFMVEANEAVAELLDRQDRKFLRRIHPDPDIAGGRQLSTFVRACGYRIPAKPSRGEIQELLESVRGRPESYAVNLALLKTFEQAEYSPMKIGHFALASRNYCHFTSPIRRYPDLTVHRLIAEHCRGRLTDRPPEDVSALVKLGEDCSAAERRAAAAEAELRKVLILQLLAQKVGESFKGVVTGVTNFGMFVQSPRFLIEGIIRLQDLGDDWWEISASAGEIRGQYGGKRYRIGDTLTVRIAGVDLPRRQLDLVLDRPMGETNRQKKVKKKTARPAPKPASAGTGAAKKRKPKRRR